MLEAAKLALRLTSDDFDDEICNLIKSAVADLWIAGVVNIDPDDSIVRTAIITYVKMHFGEPDEYDRLKKSYDEQKGQLGTASGYTEWTNQA